MRKCEVYCAVYISLDTKFIANASNISRRKYGYLCSAKQHVINIYEAVKMWINIFLREPKWNWSDKCLFYGS